MSVYFGKLKSYRCESVSGSGKTCGSIEILSLFKKNVPSLVSPLCVGLQSVGVSVMVYEMVLEILKSVYNKLIERLIISGLCKQMAESYYSFSTVETVQNIEGRTSAEQLLVSLP